MALRVMKMPWKQHVASVSTRVVCSTVLATCAGRCSHARQWRCDSNLGGIRECGPISNTSTWTVLDSFIKGEKVLESVCVGEFHMTESVNRISFV